MQRIVREIWNKNVAMEYVSSFVIEHLKPIEIRVTKILELPDKPDNPKRIESMKLIGSIELEEHHLSKCLERRWLIVSLEGNLSGLYNNNSRILERCCRRYLSAVEKAIEIADGK